MSGFVIVVSHPSKKDSLLGRAVKKIRSQLTKDRIEKKEGKENGEN
ncbi:hypothetical protein [Enterococcus sp. AZ109]